MIARVSLSAVLLLASGCATQTGVPAASTTPSATAAAPLAVGEALVVTDNQGSKAFVTVESVTYSATNGSTNTYIHDSYPPKNGVFAVVNVLVQVDAGTYAFNAFYFKWQQPDGTTSAYTDGNGAFAGFEPAFGSGQLSVGQKTRGNIVFDVPGKGGLLQITGPLFEVVGQWTMPAS